MVSVRTGYYLRMAIVLLAAVSFGCTSAPERPTTDRAFDAAVGALGDVGVQVTTSDRPSGQIRGTRNNVPVAVSIVRLPDGRTRVQFEAKGAKARDPELPSRFLDAYERRMNR
jgi:hypothetical protein